MDDWQHAHGSISTRLASCSEQASFVSIYIGQSCQRQGSGRGRGRGRGSDRIQCRRDRRTSDSSMFFTVNRDFGVAALQPAKTAENTAENTTHQRPCIVAVMRRYLSIVLASHDLAFAPGLTRQRPMPAPPLAAQQVVWTFSPCRTAGKRGASRHPSNSSIYMLWKHDIKCATR